MVGMAHFRIYPLLCSRNNHPYFILVSELVCSESHCPQESRNAGETGRHRTDSNRLQESPVTAAASSPSIASLSAGPSWPGRSAWAIGQSCLVAFTLWHLLLLFWFSEMGVVGKQQAPSFPTPTLLLQKYQITAGLLSLAQISREAKQTIFQNYVHSTIFLVYLFFLCIFFFN